jgi:hypothetical protein
VGEPTPSFSFFLANGQAPRGLMFGLHGTNFRPADLTVRHLDSGWAIVDGIRPIVRVGGNADDAKKLLQIIRQHKFDCLCQLGPPGIPGLTLLVRCQ